MPRFFINESPSRQAIITGEDSKHITKSLRMKVGESLVLCNGQGMDYHCTISSMDEHQVVVSVNSSVPTISEPSVSVTLYQGLPKSDKMDSVVQKAVEMNSIEKNEKIIKTISQSQGINKLLCRLENM